MSPRYVLTSTALLLQLLELREAQGGAAAPSSEAPLKPLTQATAFPSFLCDLASDVYLIGDQLDTLRCTNTLAASSDSHCQYAQNAPARECAVQTRHDPEF